MACRRKHACRPHTDGVSISCSPDDSELGEAMDGMQASIVCSLQKSPNGVLYEVISCNKGYEKKDGKNV